MRVRVLGIGMGPQHITREVADAISTLDYVVASEKESGNGRLSLRRKILDTYPGPYGPIPLIAIPDPPQPFSPHRSSPHHTMSWHVTRAAHYAHIFAQHQGVAGFLVWGDPSLYDSTLRLVQDIQQLGMDLDYDILPGISAPQLLAARHHIMLHEHGQPVHITTGNDLQRAVMQGNTTIIALLNDSCDQFDLTGLANWTIYWGANLGSSGEQLVCGQLAQVLPLILTRRTLAEQCDGWVLDIALLRAPCHGHIP